MNTEECKSLLELSEALNTKELSKIEKKLWSTLLVFEGHSFKTVKGLQFTYKIKGNEMFVDRKEKSITWSTIQMSLRKVIELDFNVAGPKKIGTFGASYIYPILVEFGVIRK